MAPPLPNFPTAGRKMPAFLGNGAPLLTHGRAVLFARLHTQRVDNMAGLRDLWAAVFLLAALLGCTCFFLYHLDQAAAQEPARPYPASTLVLP